MKPQVQKNTHHNVPLLNGVNETVEPLGGINLEARMVVSEDDVDIEMANWIMENLKFSVKHPVSDNQFSLCDIICLLMNRFHTLLFHGRLRRLLQRMSCNILPYSSSQKLIRWVELLLEFLGY